MRWMFVSITFFVSVVYAQMNFNTSNNQLTAYNYQTIKQWLNSYPYLYKGFTPNKGQLATTDGKPANEVLFYSRNGNMGIFITKEGMVYGIYGYEKVDDGKFSPAKAPESLIIHYSRIDYKVISANIKKENIIYEDELPGYENFYLAHCPDGILFVKSYRKVRIKDIYPGIDWILRYDEEGNFHHEFEVSPNANIAQIKIKVEYADVDVIEDGKAISFKTPIGEIRDNVLSAFEGNEPIDVRYRTESDLLSFDVKGYKGKEKLLIDPFSLIWSTYYGGSLEDRILAIYTQPPGSADMGLDIAGYTYSTNFPLLPSCGTANPCYSSIVGNADAFIMKFNSDGTRVWTTFYGGSNFDQGRSIYEDGEIGYIIVVGHTQSSNFPISCNSANNYCQSYAGGWDVFIIHFNQQGLRQWATYLGGSLNEYFSEFQPLAVGCCDDFGSWYVVGATNSTNFPVFNCTQGSCYYQQSNAGNYDAFIVKFGSDRMRKWATYFGGSLYELATSVVIPENGLDIFVVGWGQSSNFDFQCDPAIQYCQTFNAGNNEVFIAKFRTVGPNTGGSLQWSTFYGGNYDDRALSVVSCHYPYLNCDIYVLGATKSTNFPLQSAAGAYYQSTGYVCGTGCTDGFIIKFNLSGQRLWATYFGGNDWDFTGGGWLDGNFNFYIAGWTNSTANFPLQSYGNAYYQPNIGGLYDGFISVFNSSGGLLWSTYFGGSGDDGGHSNASIALNPENYDVFIAGWTNSISGFPLQPYGSAYYQPSNAGSYDGFIAKFSNITTPISSPESYIISKDYISLNLEPSNTSMNLRIYSIDGKLILSKFYNSTSSIKLDISQLKRGVYIVNVYSGDKRVINTRFIKR